MISHTPGPWTLVAEGGSHIVVTRTRGNTMRLIDDSPRGEIDANARLIAAAPELLAALKGILAGRPELWGDQVINGRTVLTIDADAADAADAAIAKAEGAEVGTS